MKNIILGMIGGAVAIYLVVFCLSVYSISARKNEMDFKGKINDNCD